MSTHLPLSTGGWRPSGDSFSSETTKIALFTLTVLTLVTGYIFSKSVFRNGAKKIPSAVAGLPLIGNMNEYFGNPIRYLLNASAKHGKFFEVNMLFTNTIWLMGTDMNKLYLEKKEDVWSFGGGMVWHPYLDSLVLTELLHRIIILITTRVSSSTKL